MCMETLNFSVDRGNQNQFLMTGEGSASSTGYNPLDSELIGLSEYSLKPPSWFCLCGHDSKTMHMQAGVHVVYKKCSFVPDLASSDTLVP